MSECNLGKDPFPYMCCCKCSMHVRLVDDYFSDHQKGWICMGVLVASKGTSERLEGNLVEPCGEHGLCELFMDKDKEPLRGFFK